MRVLVTIFEQLVPISGGGSPRISSIINSLVSKGHEVSVAASVDADKKNALEVLNCNEVISLKKVNRLDKNKMTKYLLFHPINISKVVYAATKIKPDLIIAHNSIAGLANLLARKVINCLSVVDMTDLLFEYLPSYKGIPLIQRFQNFGQQIEDKVIVDADRIITISNTMKKVLMQRGAQSENIDVVYDGVKLDIFKPQKEIATKLRQKYATTAKHVVMFHGVVDPQDQPEIILNAAKIVLNKYQDTMFWIVGDGTAIPSMKEKAKKTNISKNFFFSGWVPFADIPSFVSACDVGLVILPDTISAKIRVTLKGFEYWACEKPIVVSKLPALEEIVEDKRTGLFYNPGDPEDLAEKICILLDDKNMCKRMGKAGRELVEKKYGWNKLADEFVTICEKML